MPSKEFCFLIALKEGGSRWQIFLLFCPNELIIHVNTSFIRYCQDNGLLQLVSEIKCEQLVSEIKWEVVRYCQDNGLLRLVSKIKCEVVFGMENYLI